MASTERLSRAIQACAENAKHLQGDAELLLDHGRFGTSYAISILAEEEAAKALVLFLAKERILPWSDGVRRSLRDHACKHLVGLLIEHMNPSTENFLAWVRQSGGPRKSTYLPPSVADAINLYRHEKVRRWEGASWVWEEEPKYDRDAERLFRGVRDKTKQDALYVRISANGEVAKTPGRITGSTAEKELERARQAVDCAHRLVDGAIESLRDYERITEAMRAVFS